MLLEYDIVYSIAYALFLIDELLGKYKLNLFFILPSVYNYRKLLQLKEGIYKGIKIKGYFIGTIFDQDGNEIVHYNAIVEN